MGCGFTDGLFLVERLTSTYLVAAVRNCNLFALPAPFARALSLPNSREKRVTTALVSLKSMRRRTRAVAFSADMEEV